MKLFRFLKRLKNRIKYIFNFKQMYNWDYESCDQCGSCFKIAYTITDEKWNEIYGSENGCLCLNCFLEKGQFRQNFLTKKDFLWLSIFYGDDGHYDIIKQEKQNE